MFSRENMESTSVGMESLTRSKLFGYKRFMLKNPVYFEDISNKKATEENIIKEFETLKKLNLIAADIVYNSCKCKICRNKPERRLVYE